MEYHIEKRQYHNHLGKPSDPYYFIFSYRKFIGLFKYKKYITETKCGMGDCYNSIIEFKTIEKAEGFIQNTLCPKVPREKTKKEIIKSINCNE
jgi:hypothetical protein